MQISGESLALTWPRQALFTQSSPVLEPLLQAFPFPSTLGEVTLHQISQACVFAYSSCGRWVFPPLLWSFPPSTTLTSFPAPGCWARVPAPTGAVQPAWLVYLQFWEGFPSPSLRTQCAPPSFPCVFIVLIAYYSVSLFFPGCRSLCPGGYAPLAQGCLWEYHSTLSSPCLHLPKPSGHRQLVARGPSWFLHLT
jgi:hypothetical protein